MNLTLSEGANRSLYSRSLWITVSYVRLLSPGRTQNHRDRTRRLQEAAGPGRGPLTTFSVSASWWEWAG